MNIGKQTGLKPWLVFPMRCRVTSSRLRPRYRRLKIIQQHRLYNDGPSPRTVGLTGSLWHRPSWCSDKELWVLMPADLGARLDRTFDQVRAGPGNECYDGPSFLIVFEISAQTTLTKADNNRRGTFDYPPSADLLYRLNPRQSHRVCVLVVKQRQQMSRAATWAQVAVAVTCRTGGIAPPSTA